MNDAAKIALIKSVLGDGTDKPAAEPQGMAKFLTVADGVSLVRFAGRDTIHLAARRKAANGNPPALFTIDIDKLSRTAEARKDGAVLFSLCGDGCNFSRVEKMAISALHRWFKDRRPSKDARARAKRHAAALAAAAKDGGNW